MGKDKPEAEPASHTRTQVLRGEFGENWRSWSWFRRQWSTVSLSTVGGLALALLGVLTWAWNLNTHVTIVETHVVEPLRMIEALDKRIGRIEGVLDLDYAEQMKNWAEAVREARREGLPPPPPPKPKGKAPKGRFK
ncbi:MAG: hypothetical protein E6G57_16540 [Actinobacteria bacterium]|nr:MAG: hypothetical protein E6G57_16540 [Actinomycetota bacterium]